MANSVMLSVNTTTAAPINPSRDSGTTTRSHTWRGLAPMVNAARSRSGLIRRTAGISTSVAMGSITCIIPSHTAMGCPISWRFTPIPWKSQVSAPPFPMRSSHPNARTVSPMRKGTRRKSSATTRQTRFWILTTM